MPDISTSNPPRRAERRWRRASDFSFRAAPGQVLNDAGEIFAWQHDPEALGNDEYTIFDNESAGAANTGAGSTSQLGVSRDVRFRLDERHRTATLLQSENQPEGLTAPSQGNSQPLTGGGNVVAGDRCRISQSTTPPERWCSTPSSPPA